VTKYRQQEVWAKKEYDRLQTFYYSIRNSSSYTFEQKETYRLEWERSKLEWESSQKTLKETETRITEGEDAVKKSKEIAEGDGIDFTKVKTDKETLIKDGKGAEEKQLAILAKEKAEALALEKKAAADAKARQEAYDKTVREQEKRDKAAAEATRIYNE